MSCHRSLFDFPVFISTYLPFRIWVRCWKTYNFQTVFLFCFLKSRLNIWTILMEIWQGPNFKDSQIESMSRSVLPRRVSWNSYYWDTGGNSFLSQAPEPPTCLTSFKRDPKIVCFSTPVSYTAFSTVGRREWRGNVPFMPHPFKLHHWFSNGASCATGPHVPRPEGRIARMLPRNWVGYQSETNSSPGTKPYKRAGLYCYSAHFF